MVCVSIVIFVEVSDRPTLYNEVARKRLVSTAYWGGELTAYHLKVQDVMLRNTISRLDFLNRDADLAFRTALLNISLNADQNRIISVQVQGAYAREAGISFEAFHRSMT